MKKTAVKPTPTASVAETTEQRAARLLHRAAAPAQPLDASQEEELRLIADLLTSRARSWQHLAHTLSERARAVEQEAERVQALAAALTDAAER